MLVSLSFGVLTGVLLIVLLVGAMASTGGDLLYGGSVAVMLLGYVAVESNWPDLIGLWALFVMVGSLATASVFYTVVIGQRGGRAV